MALFGLISYVYHWPSLSLPRFSPILFLSFSHMHNITDEHHAVPIPFCKYKTYLLWLKSMRRMSAKHFIESKSVTLQLFNILASEEFCAFCFLTEKQLQYLGSHSDRMCRRGLTQTAETLFQMFYLSWTFQAFSHGPCARKAHRWTRTMSEFTFS